MRAFSVVLIGLLLASSGQLVAQTADPFGAEADPSGVGSDPFGSFGAGSSARKPALPPKNPQAKKPAPSQPAAPFPSFSIAGRTSASYVRIEQALNRDTTFDYLDQPLKDVVEDISFNHSIPIILDTRALEDYGIDTGTPIIRSLKGVSLRSALRLMLRDIGLTFVIRDEVLQITTSEVAEMEPSTRFYPVGDLLPPSGEGKVLVELIKTVVSPNTWSDSGGLGAIVYVEHIETIVVRQTEEVFHAIDQLLAATKQQIVGKQLLKASSKKLDPFE